MQSKKAQMILDAKLKKLYETIRVQRSKNESSSSDNFYEIT